MAAKLFGAGRGILEAGFPIASDGDFDSGRRRSAGSFHDPGGGAGAVLHGDVERAAKSLAHAKPPRIHYFYSTSDIHLKFKLKKTQQQVWTTRCGVELVAAPRGNDVEFSAEDGARPIGVSGAHLESRGCGGRALRHIRIRWAIRRRGNMRR